MGSGKSGGEARARTGRLHRWIGAAGDAAKRRPAVAIAVASVLVASTATAGYFASRSAPRPQAVASEGTPGQHSDAPVAGAEGDALGATTSSTAAIESTLRSGRRPASSGIGSATSITTPPVTVPPITVPPKPDGPTPLLDRVVGPGLYVVDRDGRNLRRVSNKLDPPGGDATWSPDGRRLTYAWRATPSPDGSNPDGMDGLCVVSADGSGARDLGVHGTGPRWSPDGLRIAYTMGTQPGGSGVATVTPSGAGGQVVVASNGSAPRWSPNGLSLAFISGPTGPKSSNYQLRVQTAGVARVLVPDDASGSITWAPNGTRLSYVAPSTQRAFGTHLIDADGSDDVAIDDHLPPTGMGSLGWSPDGRFLVSEHSWNGDTIGAGPNHVQIRNADGTGVRDLAQATFPAWSPRDDVIAMVDMRVKRPDGIWDYDLQLINADGSNRHTIVEDPENLIIHNVVWSPDASRIAFAVRYNAHPKTYEDSLHDRC